ncbi:MAG TPA: FAD-dependent thymidylate synthase [Candidatus Woesebacteria bacterium]|nr:FAD-dependent thymidylate synthase [Candidatus Woesebacteria bacterium]
MVKEAILEVRLVDHYNNPDKTAGIAIRRCYSNLTYEELDESLTQEDIQRLVNQVEGSGHTSTLEHQLFTFHVSGLSRTAEVQLVRKRVGASYSVRSGRYVDMSEAEYVIPNSIRNSPFYDECMARLDENQELYSRMINSGIPPEDARFFQTQNLATRLVVSMTGLGMLQFLEKRECTRAQWEIREMAIRMHQLIKPISPIIFDNAGPTCKTQGICWEGKRSCGLWRAIEGGELRTRKKHNFNPNYRGDLLFIDQE